MITGSIDEAPLALRDGAVVVVRSTTSATAAAVPAAPPRTTCATPPGDMSSRAILPAAGAGVTAVRAKNVLFRKGSTADNLLDSHPLPTYIFFTLTLSIIKLTLIHRRNKPWEVDAPRVPYKHNPVDAATSLKIQRPPLRERSMKITSTAASTGTDNTTEVQEQQNLILEETPTAESPLHDLPTPVYK